MEQIYTIPVNEAFEAHTESAPEAKEVCPFCQLKNDLHRIEVDQILGAAMMEPDIRIMTNRFGFCDSHFDMMLRHGKKLPLALILESHLAETREKIKKPGILPAASGKDTAKAISDLSESCYLCGRINQTFQAMLQTAAYLWQTEEKFRTLTSEQRGFCLPHFAKFLSAAKERMSGKEFARFYQAVFAVEAPYLEGTNDDVSYFCKKFDYQHLNDPWNGCEDAPERAIRLLAGWPYKEET